MKKQNEQDERVVAQRRKINSEAYGILMFALLCSILVQEFFLDAPFQQYAAEVICFLGATIYMIVRYMMLGLNLYSGDKQTKAIPFVSSIATGIVITAINGVFNYTRYAERYKEDGIGYFIAVLAVTFISATIFVSVLLSFLNYINKKKQAQIQKQLDKDESND